MLSKQILRIMGGKQFGRQPTLPLDSSVPLDDSELQNSSEADKQSIGSWESDSSMEIDHNHSDSSDDTKCDDDSSDPSEGEDNSNDFFFYLILVSTATNEKEQRKITFTRFPRTGIVLKREIENRYNIPICVQSLSFNSDLLHNKTRLKSLRIRTGDKLTLQYIGKAEIEYFSKTIATLRRIVTSLKRIMPKKHGDSNVITDDATRIDCLDFANDTAYSRYMSVFPTGLPNANHFFFLHNNGLKLLIRMYQLVHHLPWSQLPFELQAVEYACLNYVSKLSCALGVRQLLLHEGAVECVLKSLLRTEIMPFAHVQPLKSLSQTQCLIRMVSNAVTVTGK